MRPLFVEYQSGNAYEAPWKPYEIETTNNWKDYDDSLGKSFGSQQESCIAICYEIPKGQVTAK